MRSPFVERFRAIRRVIQRLTETCRKQNGPAPVGCGAVRVHHLNLSWPAGGGRPGYRADPPPLNYAQEPAGRADRGPAAHCAWRIPTPGLRYVLPAAAAMAALAADTAVPFAALPIRCAVPGPL